MVDFFWETIVPVVFRKQLKITRIVQSSIFQLRAPKDIHFKTHSIEQFNQNEITLQDCGITIIIIVQVLS